MLILKDYLGSLVSDLNHARVIADVETAKIAKLYAQDEVLKRFSIPRMKIQDTELTIPIAIEQLDSSALADHQPIDNTSFYSKTYAVIKSVFEVSSFNQTTAKALRSAIYSHIETLEKSIISGVDTTKSLTHYNEMIADLSIKQVVKDKAIQARAEKTAESQDVDADQIDADQIKELLKTKLTSALFDEIKPREMTGKLENLQVTVESDKLKEKKPESLLYIKMKITEESMEWHTMEDADGNVVNKLMVE